MAYRIGEPPDMEDWLDVAVKRIWDESDVLPLANQEKLKNSEPHLVWSPECCISCEMWGGGLADDSGECSWCGGYVGDDLLRKFNEYYKPLDKEGE